MAANALLLRFTAISDQSPYLRNKRSGYAFCPICIWLYFHFALSYRNIEEMMAKRGVQLTYETIREWCHKFGPVYAAKLRKKRRGSDRSGTWMKSSSR
jgi:hypothetical protein